MVVEIFIKAAQTKLFLKVEGVFCRHIYGFRPIDVYNKVETRGQLKIKTKASSKFQLRYQKWVKLYSKGSFTSSDFDSDSDSNSNSDNESLANNTSETEQILSDDEIKDKLIINETKETEQNLSLNPKSLAEKGINLYAKDSFNSDSSLANNTTTNNTSENFNETSETADNK